MTYRYSRKYFLRRQKLPFDPQKQCHVTRRQLQSSRVPSIEAYNSEIRLCSRWGNHNTCLVHKLITLQDRSEKWALEGFHWRGLDCRNCRQQSHTSYAQNSRHFRIYLRELEWWLCTARDCNHLRIIYDDFCSHFFVTYQNFPLMSFISIKFYLLLCIQTESYQIIYFFSLKKKSLFKFNTNTP